MDFAERVIARAAPERRAISEWGTSAIPGPLGEPVSYGSFSSIDLRRGENSLQKVAVWSACDLIASLAAHLPVDTYQRQPDGTSRPVDNSPLILDPGGEGYGASDWIYQYLMSKLLRGNVYGKVLGLDQRGYPTQIVLYHPDDVQGWRDKQTGEVVWRVGGIEQPAGSVWHKRSYPLPGALLGMSPVAKHMTTISEGMAATRFGLQFFTDGAHPSSLLQNDQVEIDQNIAAEVKTRYLAAVHGTREPLVMGKGWTHKAISVNPEESQFLETQKYTAAECARIFGPNVAEILGYETGGSMTYSNVEQRSIDLMKFTLNRWLRDLEATFSALLPRPRYVRFNRNALLETDLLSRYQAHRTAREIGLSNIDELRAMEDLPPLPNGQGQEYTPLLIQIAASRGIDAAQVKSGQPPADQSSERGQVWDGEVVEPLAIDRRGFDPAEPRDPHSGKWLHGAGAVSHALKSLSSVAVKDEGGGNTGVSFANGPSVSLSARQTTRLIDVLYTIGGEVDPGEPGTSYEHPTARKTFKLASGPLTVTAWGSTDDNSDVVRIEHGGHVVDMNVREQPTPTDLAEHIANAAPEEDERAGQLAREFRKAIAHLSVMDLRAAGHDTTPGHDELHHYWTVGEGRAKWVTSPKPWTTLVALLTPHVGPEKAKVYASRWFIEVFGFAAGSDLNRVTHGHPPRGHRVGPG